MLFGTIGQAWVFLWMAATGGLMGAWYLAMAALRRLLRAGVVLSLLTDLAFALGAGAIFCAALVAANHGQMRLYIGLGALLGFNMFAVGVVLPAKRAIRAVYRAAHRFIVYIAGQRWINVILK